jgi:hypothetical protein
MNDSFGQDSRLFTQNLSTLSEYKQSSLMTVLTSPIVFELRLEPTEGSYLGKNHQKLAIPAKYVGCVAGKSSEVISKQIDVKPPQGSLSANPNCLTRHRGNSYPVATSPGLSREFV